MSNQKKKKTFSWILSGSFLCLWLRTNLFLNFHKRCKFLYYCFCSPETLFPDILFSRTKKKRNIDEELSLLRTVCRVCGQKKCPRHRPELNIIAFQPWTCLEIPQVVDHALEEVQVFQGRLLWLDPRFYLGRLSISVCLFMCVSVCFHFFLFDNRSPFLVYQWSSNFVER